AGSHIGETLGSTALHALEPRFGTALGAPDSAKSEVHLRRSGFGVASCRWNWPHLTSPLRYRLRGGAPPGADGADLPISQAHGEGNSAAPAFYTRVIHRADSNNGGLRYG